MVTLAVLVVESDYPLPLHDIHKALKPCVVGGMGLGTFQTIIWMIPPSGVTFLKS